jgi:hypothetical protein
MAEQTVYCEECVEDIPASEVYWEEGRLYCRRCGSEVEAPDRDIFEEIVDNRTGFLFRDAEPPDLDADEEEEEEEGEAEAAEAEPDAAAADDREDGDAPEREEE